MWSAGRLLNAPSNAIDLDEELLSPDPGLVPMPSFAGGVNYDGSSDFSVTSLPYSPSFCSMEAYGDSSATPSTPSSDGDPELYLRFCADISEYRFLGPPSNRADGIAYVAMREGLISYGQIGLLTGLLPMRNRGHPRYSANDHIQACFGTGAFTHGPHAGVRKRAAEFPWCSALLAAMLRAYFPGKFFSSCVLQMNMSTNAHRDLHNDASIDNLVLACSKWEGGQLWLEDEGGDTVLEDGSRGRLISLQPCATFNGHIRHKAMPWTGSRTVLVGYHIRDAWRLCLEDVQSLQRLGFMLQCSTD